jgi:hypothetical protein
MEEGRRTMPLARQRQTVDPEMIASRTLPILEFVWFTSSELRLVGDHDPILRRNNFESIRKLKLFLNCFKVGIVAL